MIEVDSETESGNSMLSARLNEDDDDDDLCEWVCVWSDNFQLLLVIAKNERIVLLCFPGIFKIAYQSSEEEFKHIAKFTIRKSPSNRDEHIYFKIHFSFLLERK